jgi:DHA1 family tetracycline resistance protein-like MFS transporter
LVTALMQGVVIRPLIARLGERRTIVMGLSFSALGYLLYAAASQAWMMYGVIVLNGFDFVTKPTCQGLLSTQVGAREQGALQGAIASQTALAAIVGPFIATNLFGYFTSKAAPFQLPEIPFLVGVCLFGLALWFAITTFSKQLHHDDISV